MSFRKLSPPFPTPAQNMSVQRHTHTTTRDGETQQQDKETKPEDKKKNTNAHTRPRHTTRHIIFHEENAAQLAICGGISGGGADQRCGGPPAATTVGRRGSAVFSLRAVRGGATIDISKVRWEECVHAARAVCPTGSLSATCLGGATSGDVAFSLDVNWKGRGRD